MMLQLVQNQVASGELRHNKVQERVAKWLSHLQDALVGYANSAIVLRIPRGLYIHGPVGTGKTMMMDIFYKQVDIKKKARYHFHSFLALVHLWIHKLKQDDLRNKGRNFSIDMSPKSNPIHWVGLQLASQLSLLCLDRFQVSDIADALLLSKLFGAIFHNGTRPNRPPTDL
jgi:predicted ATPase